MFSMILMHVEGMPSPRLDSDYQKQMEDYPLVPAHELMMQNT